MDLNTAARLITRTEGLRKSISIAQVKEILKITNTLVAGELYKLIRKVK